VKRALFAMLLVACGAPAVAPPPPDSGTPVDSGTPYAPPTVDSRHSLFWTLDSGVLDEVSFKGLMDTASDGHAGPLLNQWFNAFTMSPAGGRSTEAQYLVDFASAGAGSDPAQWDLAQMSFKVTGVHNRIDRADYSVGGHCGELRASVASTNVNLQPFHALFIFRQPAGAGDVAADGHVTCVATARKWAELSRLDGEALSAAVRALIRDGFLRERFELVETVENTLSPWEWRQWVKGAAAAPLPFTLMNPPLFQQLDVEGLNVTGSRRDAFLVWVADNAAALNARTLLYVDQFKTTIAQVPPAGARPPLKLDGLRADVAAAYPQLRQQIEMTGCAACHTADAEFVQTQTTGKVSNFYEKELTARERHLEKMSRGEQPYAPFGPLQLDPVLTP